MTERRKETRKERRKEGGNEEKVSMDEVKET